MLDVKRLDLPDREAPVYRLRVGDWRVVYLVAGTDVLVVRIFHRSEGYQWLETFGL